MATRISNPVIQHFDKGTKSQLAGGQLFFFETESTDPKATFIDAEESQPNTNPVILDGNGFEPNIFGNGSYKVVLQNSDGVQQWERDPVVFSAEEGAFSEWIASTFYSTNNIVEGSDGRFYIAILANSASDPSGGANSDKWSEFDLINRWNVNENYVTDDVVRGSDGIIYTSIADGPTLDPTADTGSTEWKMFDNIRIDGNTISGSTANGQVNITSIGDSSVNINSSGNADVNISSSGSGAVNLNSNDDDAGDINLNAGTLSGNINLNPGTSGSLLSNGDAVGLALVTQQLYTVGGGLWNRPAGVKYIIVELIGGGAAGGGAPNSATISGGQGGGAGSYSRTVVDVTAITSVSLTVGVGGIGFSNATGGNGGNTTFDLTTVITSGGGIGGSRSTTALDDDNGGTATNGDLNVRGGPGNGPGIAPASTINGSGEGGSSYFGGGGNSVTDSTITVGVTATVIGAGGGGALAGTGSVRAGGRGANGFLIVTEYR